MNTLEISLERFFEVKDFSNIKKIIITNIPQKYNISNLLEYIKDTPIEEIELDNKIDESKLKDYDIVDDYNKKTLLIGDKKVIIKPRKNIKNESSTVSICSKNLKTRLPLLLEYGDTGKTKEFVDIYENKINYEGRNYQYRIYNDGKTHTLFIERFEDLKEAYNLVNTLKKYGYNIKRIYIKLENKNYEHIEYLYQMCSMYNVSIVIYDIELSFKEYFSLRNILENGKILLKMHNLSPLEKIMYSYDIIKTFIYRKTKEDDYQSVQEEMKYYAFITLFISNYSQIFNDLLKEVGIYSRTFKSNIRIDYSAYRHDTSLIYIDDNKYNLHGLFMFDPLIDSVYGVFDKEDDYIFKYKCFLVNKDEYLEKYKEKNLPNLSTQYDYFKKKLGLDSIELSYDTLDKSLFDKLLRKVRLVENIPSEERKNRTK